MVMNSFLFLKLDAIADPHTGLSLYPSEIILFLLITFSSNSIVTYEIVIEWMPKVVFNTRDILPVIS